MRAGYLRTKNANLLSNRGGCLEVITRQHMNSDSGRLALFDSACRFKARRIVEAYKANESQVVFDESAALQRIPIGCCERSACETEHTQSLCGHCICLSVDGFLGGIVHAFDKRQDDFCGSFGET